MDSGRDTVDKSQLYSARGRKARPMAIRRESQLKTGGTMDKLTEEQVFAIQVRWACGQSVKDTAAELHHSLSTVSKYYGIAKASWNSYDPKVYLDPREQALQPHRFSNRKETRATLIGQAASSTTTRSDER